MADNNNSSNGNYNPKSNYKPSVGKLLDDTNSNTIAQSVDRG
jgi:hypothetical protein